MCLSPDAYVAARVYERLVARGVSPSRAAGVARKVQSRYSASRRKTANLLLPAGKHLE